jgi:hypothetical protein
VKECREGEVVERGGRVRVKRGKMEEEEEEEEEVWGWGWRVGERGGVSW